MASRYWVGGTANWDGTAGTKWATTSGGVGGAAVPTASDDVFFDGSSGTGTVTISAAATCLNLDFTGFTGTLAGTSTLAISGNLTLATGMTRTYNGVITFNATSGTKTINTNGITLSRAITFNGSGGTFQLTSALTLVGSGGGGATLTLTAGTFDANGYLVTIDGTGNSNSSITGAFTFASLTYTGAASTASNLALSANITVTGTLTLNGNSSTNRSLLQSTVKGTQRTITAATVSAQYLDIQDISGAGAASWDLSAITGLSGDCGGNSNITFTSPVTNYWVPSGGTSTGNFNAVTRWANASGGTAGTGRIPLPQDTARFDASSIDAGSRTITQGMARTGSIDFTGVTNTPTFTTSTAASVFGSITLVSGMTLTASTQTYTFEGRGSYTLTSAGKTWGKAITINAPGGTLTFQDAFAISAANLAFTLTRGTLNDGGFNVTINHFIATGTATRALTMSGLWTVGQGQDNVLTPWNVASTGMTLTANSPSKIKLTMGLTAGTRSFAGAGFTYYDFEYATTGAFNFTIAGSNTFNNFHIDASAAARTLLFTAGTTQTVAGFTRNSGTNIITLDSTTTGTYSLTKTGGGVVSVDYMNIQHCVARPWSGASGADTWYAGTNSTNNQAVATAGSGWIFTAPPSGGVVKTVNGLAVASIKTINGVAVASVKAYDGNAYQ